MAEAREAAVGGNEVAQARDGYDPWKCISLSLEGLDPDSVPARVTSPDHYHSRSRKRHLSSSSSLHACKEE